MKRNDSPEKNKENINKNLARAEKLYDEYISLGTLEEVGVKYGVTDAAVSRLLKRWSNKGLFKYPPKELRLENIRNKILKDYKGMVDKLGHHPTAAEMSQHAEWKNIYHRIVYRYRTLTNFRQACGCPMPSEKKIKRIRASRANQLYRDYVTLGTLEKVGKLHNITKERVRQILKYGDSKGLFNYPERKLVLSLSMIKENADSQESHNIMMKIKEEYDRLGSLKGVAKKYGKSHETVRQILTIGNNIGLFEFPPKKESLYTHITKQRLYDDLLEYGSIYKLCRYYKVSHEQLEEAMRKYDISMPAIKLELSKAKVLKAYQDLLRVLGHYPSTTEIGKRHGYLLVRIKKIWGSIYAFRKCYGFPNPKMGSRIRRK